MLYVLFGKDTYRSRKKLRDITERFYHVAGGRESAVCVLLFETSRQELERVLTTGSLFHAKRLFIMEEPSKAPADVLAYIQDKLPAFAKSDNVYVVWDREFVNEHIVAHATKTQEFSDLTPQNATRFLDEEAHARGVSLNVNEKQHILADAHGNSWRIIQEIEKSALIKDFPAKEASSEGHKGSAPTDRAIFDLLDAYCLRQSSKILQIYATCIQSGMEPEKIFWRLLSHAKAMLSIYALIQRGVAVADIPREAGAHPFVVKKITSARTETSLQYAKTQHASLVALDFETKRGQGDLALGLERMFLKLR